MSPLPHASSDSAPETRRSDSASDLQVWLGKVHFVEQGGTGMIEFFFDCSSPWTYLAFRNIGPLAREFGEEIHCRPILVGGIFNAINPSVYHSREKPVPAKARYYK